MTCKCSDLMEAENVFWKRSSVAALSPKGGGMVYYGLFIVCTSNGRLCWFRSGSRCLFIWYL